METEAFNNINIFYSTNKYKTQVSNKNHIQNQRHPT